MEVPELPGCLTHGSSRKEAICDAEDAIRFWIKTAQEDGLEIPPAARTFGLRLNPGEPFGFTEYGPHGSQNPPGDYDYRRFVEGVEKHFPKTCFFMSWNAKWSLATNHNVKALLEHPSVANREDLPKGLFDRATAAH